MKFLLSLKSKLLNNIKLRNQLITLFFAAFAIPVAIVSVYYMLSVISMASEKMYLTNETNASQLKLNLQNEIEHLSEAVFFTSSDFDINSFFMRDYGYAGEFFADYILVRNKLAFISATTFRDMRTWIYTTNPTILPNYHSIFYCAHDNLPEWYNTALKSGYKLSFEIDGDNMIIYRAISNPDSDAKRTAVFLLSVPLSRLDEYYQSDNIGSNIYLVGPDNLVYSSNVEGIRGKPFVVEGVDDGKPNVFFETFVVDKGSGEWMLVYDSSERTLYPEIPKLLGTGLFIIVAALTIVIISIIYISRFISSRINKLNSAVFQHEYTIRTLEIENKEAKIQALQSQIEPHFLFNTLQTISMLLQKNDNEQSAMVVNSLAMLMRNAIYLNGDAIPLRDEINMVLHYLKIQKSRYCDRLSFEIDILPEYEMVEVLQFSVQPLVENTIRHGIEPLEHGGKLWIYARKEENALEIIVGDNGVGINAERLERIRGSLTSASSQDSKPNTNIGIKNIHQRLRLHFGEGFGIVDMSSGENGTNTVLRVPFKLHPSFFAKGGEGYV